MKVQAVQIGSEHFRQQIRCVADLGRTKNPAMVDRGGGEPVAILGGEGVIEREYRNMPSAVADERGLRGDSLEHAAPQPGGRGGEQSDPQAGQVCLHLRRGPLRAYDVAVHGGGEPPGAASVRSLQLWLRVAPGPYRPGA